MTEVHLDFEILSEADLKKVGGALYAEHPSTDINCLAYGEPDDKVGIWLITPIDLKPDSPYEGARRLRQLAADPTVIFVAHNAAFEQNIWREVMVKKYGFPEIPIHRWRCTMAKCYAHGLPGSLEMAGRYLQLDMQKDKAGYDAMMLLCRPKKGTTDKFWRYDEKPNEFNILYNYCLQDVRSEMALDAALRNLSPTEQYLWCIDQEINQRGIFIDMPMVIKAVEFTEEHKRRGKNRFRGATLELSILLRRESRPFGGLMNEALRLTIPGSPQLEYSYKKRIIYRTTLLMCLNLLDRETRLAWRSTGNSSTEVPEELFGSYFNITALIPEDGQDGESRSRI